MRIISKPGKSQYTEDEVAKELGVSVERLRTFIRDRVMTTGDDVRQAPGLTFQPSDLLLLRLLTSQAGGERFQG